MLLDTPLCTGGPPTMTSPALNVHRAEAEKPSQAHGLLLPGPGEVGVTIFIPKRKETWR